MIDAARVRQAPRRARPVRDSDVCTVIAGGTADDSEGYFVRPTVVECSDPSNDVFTTEYFGPILGVHVYDDAKFEDGGQAGRVGVAVRPDRVDLRRPTAGSSNGRRRRCGTPPATSTSTTSRPVPSSASSRSAARAPPAPTTRPVRGRTWSGGCHRGRSRKPSSRRPSTPTRTWAEGCAAGSLRRSTAALRAAPLDLERMLLNSSTERSRSGWAAVTPAAWRSRIGDEAGPAGPASCH